MIANGAAVAVRERGNRLVSAGHTECCMTKVTPARPPEPEVVRFQVNVSSAWIEEQIIATGRRPATVYRIDFDLSEIESSDLRRRLYAAARACQGLLETITLDRPEADPEAFARAIESWLMLTGRGLSPDQFAAEMQAWISEYGSARLRTAAARGYKVNATYARERAAIEYPKFWVHTGQEAIWTERTDPSDWALRVERTTLTQVRDSGRQLDVRIVWLRQPPADLAAHLDDVGEVFESIEAIVIRPYLGRYTLVLPLGLPRPEGDDDDDE